MFVQRARYSEKLHVSHNTGRVLVITESNIFCRIWLHKNACRSTG